MKNQFKSLAALFLAFAMLSALAPADARADISSTFNEIRESLKDIRETWEGIGRFTAAVTRGLQAISKVVSPGALALLAAVILFSAGFSAIGIPKGHASFFVSLVTVNAVWFLWERSMRPDSLEFILTMLRTNLWLILPYFFIVLFIRLIHIVMQRLLFRFSPVRRLSFPAKKRDREEMEYLLAALQESSSHLRDALEADIEGREGGGIILSGATRHRIDEIEGVIRKLKGKG